MIGQVKVTFVKSPCAILSICDASMIGPCHQQLMGHGCHVSNPHNQSAHQQFSMLAWHPFPEQTTLSHQHQHQNRSHRNKPKHRFSTCGRGGGGRGSDGRLIPMQQPKQQSIAVLCVPRLPPPAGRCEFAARNAKSLCCCNSLWRSVTWLVRCPSPITHKPASSACAWAQSRQRRPANQRAGPVVWYENKPGHHRAHR